MITVFLFLGAYSLDCASAADELNEATAAVNGIHTVQPA
jgi:hypothetical protein